MRKFVIRQALQPRASLHHPSFPKPWLQASGRGATTAPPIVSGPSPDSDGRGFRPRFAEELARARLSASPEQVLRKERDEAPAILPGMTAESWLYADDPTGHVASIYFETFSTDLDEVDNGVLYGVNLLLEDSEPPTKVTFRGHADSTGDAASNQELSLQRAERVKAWFPLPNAKTAVEVIGLGEQGPEATADNAAELSHYRRVDVVIEPPRRTTPREPWKGSGSKYASEKLQKQMVRALDALDATIMALSHAVLGGAPTAETTAALERYFPDPRYRSAEFPQTLLAEILHIRSRIDSVNYREVRLGDIHVHCSTEPYRNVESDWDRDLCVAIRGAQRGNDLHAVAFGYPADNPGTVVLMPTWYGMADPASILVHEAAHLLLGFRGHPTEVPHRDPYAIQGFVSELGSLQAPAAEKKYPPP